jgi:hypothetical protein
MSIPLLYSDNAEIKYPLSDFDENAVPTDILLDLSLTVPEGYAPVVGAVRISAHTAFVAIEDRLTGIPLATAAVALPKAAIVYPLQMDVDGFGWVVFGPGLARAYYSGAITAELDPETWGTRPVTAPVFSLDVNGYTYAAANILELLSRNDIVTVERDGGTIYLDRNDAVLGAVEIAAFTDFVAPADFTDVVESIGGVLPDAAGNINIVFTGCFADCDDVWALEVPRGDVGEGTGESLPLDILQPREALDGEACLPSGDGSSGGSDPFDGCQVITPRILLDIADDHEVGTLYTIS